MKNHRLRRIILIAVFIIAVLCVWVRVRPPLLYFINTLKPHELPPRLVKPAFKYITGHSLPGKTEQLQAIFHGGRDPAIFVQFYTDDEGISYIQQLFSEIGYREFETIPDYMLSPNKGIFDFFTTVRQWIDRLGISNFDNDKLESGLKCEANNLNPEFRVIIDTDRNKVYIHAWLR